MEHAQDQDQCDRCHERVAEDQHREQDHTNEENTTAAEMVQHISGDRADDHRAHRENTDADPRHRFADAEILDIQRQRRVDHVETEKDQKVDAHDHDEWARPELLCHYLPSPSSEVVSEDAASDFWLPGVSIGSKRVRLYSLITEITLLA